MLVSAEMGLRSARKRRYSIEAMGAAEFNVRMHAGRFVRSSPPLRHCGLPADTFAARRIRSPAMNLFDGESSQTTGQFGAGWSGSITPNPNTRKAYGQLLGSYHELYRRNVHLF